MVLNNQMRWTGHLVCMNESETSFFWQILFRKRRQHKPKKRFKGILKNGSSIMEIECNGRETLTTDPADWKHPIADGKSFESNRVLCAVVKIAYRKGKPSPIVDPQSRSCDVCVRYLLSNAGLVDHIKTHENRTSTTAPVVIPLSLGH